MKKTFFILGLALLFTACSSNDFEEAAADKTTQKALIVEAGIQKLNTKAIINTRSTTSTDGLNTGPIMRDYFQGNTEIGLIISRYSDRDPYPGITGETCGNLKCQQNGAIWDLESIFHLNSTQTRVFAYFPYDKNLGKNIVDGEETFDTRNIPVKPGYTDYLMGDCIGGCLPTASDPKAKLILYHSLSMISFTFQKKEMSSPADLSQVQSITLHDIFADGIRGISGWGAKPTGTEKCDLRVARFANEQYLPADVENAISNSSWAEWKGPECSFGLDAIGKVSESSYGEIHTRPLFHALVIPQKGLTETVTEGAPYAAIKVDDVVYNIPLSLQKLNSTDDNQTHNNWLNGKHYVYNLTYRNKVLTVASVTVNQWQEGGSSDIEI